MDAINEKGYLIKTNPKLALLVDAENVPAQILEEAYEYVRNEYGEPIVKRAYADWTNSNLAPWQAVLSHAGFRSIHQAAIIKGKNTSDITLCVDTMFLHFENQIEHFAIMTHDSDYTNLFLRLRERGVRITLLCSNKAVQHLSPAANVIHTFPMAKSVEKPINRSPEEALRELHRMVYEATLLHLDKNGNTSISELGSQLALSYPGFSIKEYGFKKLTDYICAFPFLYKPWFKNNIVAAFKCISPPKESVDAPTEVVLCKDVLPIPATNESESVAPSRKIDAKYQLLAANIRLFLEDHGAKSKKEIMSAFSLNDNVARRVITDMMKCSVLQMIGKGVQTKYDIIRIPDECNKTAN